MNCQNSKMENMPLIMELDNQNFENAFKDIFIKDIIIGEENEDNMNIVVEDEIFNNAQSFGKKVITRQKKNYKLHMKKNF